MKGGRREGDEGKEKGGRREGIGGNELFGGDGRVGLWARGLRGGGVREAERERGGREALRKRREEKRETGLRD